MKKPISIGLIVLGAILFLFGTHVDNQAAQGEQNLSQAESSEQNGRRPVIGPVRRGISSQESQAAQQRIGQAGQQVVATQVTANWLRGSGIVLVILGIGCLIYYRNRP